MTPRSDYYHRLRRPNGPSAGAVAIDVLLWAGIVAAGYWALTW